MATGKIRGGRARHRQNAAGRANAGDATFASSPGGKHIAARVVVAVPDARATVRPAPRTARLPAPQRRFYTSSPTPAGTFLRRTSARTDYPPGHPNAGDAGGVWDSNNPGNPRGDMFDPAGTTGTLLNFRGVKGLTLRNMTLRDPECYYIRLCEARDFRVEDILFDSPHLRPNQDGVHLAGYCERGVIRRLRGAHG